MSDKTEAVVEEGGGSVNVVARLNELTEAVRQLEKSNQMLVSKVSDLENSQKYLTKVVRSLEVANEAYKKSNGVVNSSSEKAGHSPPESIEIPKIDTNGMIFLLHNYFLKYFLHYLFIYLFVFIVYVKFD